MYEYPFFVFVDPDNVEIVLVDTFSTILVPGRIILDAEKFEILLI